MTFLCIDCEFRGKKVRELCGVLVRVHISVANRRSHKFSNRNERKPEQKEFHSSRGNESGMRKICVPCMVKLLASGLLMLR